MRLSDSIRFYAATDVGSVRDHNEDNFLVDKKLALFVVADGMGGHAAGEVASALAVRIVHEEIKQRDASSSRTTSPARRARARSRTKDILALLEHAVQRACARIHEEAQADAAQARHGHDALVRCSSSATQGFIAHVGDSRIYLLARRPHPAGHRGPHRLQRAHQAREAHRASRSRRSRRRTPSRAPSASTSASRSTRSSSRSSPATSSSSRATASHGYIETHRRARAATSRTRTATPRPRRSSSSPTSAAARTTSPPSSCASARRATTDDDARPAPRPEARRPREDAALRAPQRARAPPRHAGRRGARLRRRDQVVIREGDAATSSSSCSPGRCASSRGEQVLTRPRRRASTSARWRSSAACPRSATVTADRAARSSSPSAAPTSSRSSARSTSSRSSCSGSSSASSPTASTRRQRAPTARSRSSPPRTSPTHIFPVDVDDIAVGALDAAVGDARRVRHRAGAGGRRRLRRLRARQDAAAGGPRRARRWPWRRR